MRGGRSWPLMDMSLLRPLNQLFAHHDGLEDLLVAYANTSEMLFLGLLIAAFVLVRGELAHRSAVRRAVVAAGLSAGLGLALAQVISRLVARASFSAPRCRVARRERRPCSTRRPPPPAASDAARRLGSLGGRGGGWLLALRLVA